MKGKIKKAKETLLNLKDDIIVEFNSDFLEGIIHLLLFIIVATSVLGIIAMFINSLSTRSKSAILTLSYVGKYYKYLSIPILIMIILYIGLMFIYTLKEGDKRPFVTLIIGIIIFILPMFVLYIAYISYVFIKYKSFFILLAFITVIAAFVSIFFLYKSLKLIMEEDSSLIKIAIFSYIISPIIIFLTTNYSTILPLIGVGLVILFFTSIFGLFSGGGGSLSSSTPPVNTQKEIAKDKNKENDENEIIDEYRGSIKLKISFSINYATNIVEMAKGIGTPNFVCTEECFKKGKVIIKVNNKKIDYISKDNPTSYDGHVVIKKIK